MVSTDKAVEIVEDILTLALADSISPTAQNTREDIVILNEVRRSLGIGIKIVITDQELKTKLIALQNSKQQPLDRARQSHISHI